MSWIKDAIKEQQSNATWISPPLGQTQVTIDISKPPEKKQLPNKDGTFRIKHEFPTTSHEGKVLSCTPYLYGEITKKLEEHADQNYTTASLVIDCKATREGKKQWTVFIKELK